MDAPPVEGANENPEYEKKFIAIGTRSFSDVDFKNLGKELIERFYGITLAPVQANAPYGGFPDFIHSAGDSAEILVNIKGWSRLTIQYLEDLDRTLKKQIDVYNPKLLILLVFHFVENNLESELTRSVTTYKSDRGSVEFRIFDAYWVATALSRNKDLDKKYFKDGSPTELLSDNEQPVTEPKGSVPADEVIRNTLKRSVIDNDSSGYEKDLLGFGSDLRAFASTIALRETSPPLAIALLGNWGTGKSFFMSNLEKNVGVLSASQGFDTGSDKVQSFPEGSEKPYCEGIVQIRFNAWSYIDANLYAGIVVNIFEKLDEYISRKTRGLEWKEKAQSILAEQLSIVSAEKENLLTESKRLEDENAGFQSSLAELRDGKNALYNEFLIKQAEDTKAKVLTKASELAEPLIQKLKDQGISLETDQLSPSEINAEIHSWSTFFRNFRKFSLAQIALFSVIFLTLLYLWYFPLKELTEKGLLDAVTTNLIKTLVAIASVVFPVITKVNSALRKAKSLLEPLREYRDKFNASLAEAEEARRKAMEELSAGIEERESQIRETEASIRVAGEKISYYRDALASSVTKRAFCSFIEEKARGRDYQNSLGIVSVIRRDFEVLSELFTEIEAPAAKPGIDQENEVKKQNTIREFRDSFNTPLERIVLYIDDLDRCSDEKVLEVLQAVHLLMAYPLFIVVVGVDKRCVFNALNYKNLVQYSKFTRSKHPEELKEFGINVIQPHEYLEKIFQIVFNLKDASGNEIKDMISKLLEKQVEQEKAAEQASARAGISENEGISSEPDAPDQEINSPENKPAAGISQD
nr:KAP family NTPase [Bacteroidales bacterium]